MVSKTKGQGSIPCTHARAEPRHEARCRSYIGLLIRGLSRQGVLSSAKIGPSAVYDHRLAGCWRVSYKHLELGSTPR